MPSTACSCLRSGLALMVPDPDCKAPSHLWDQLEALDPYKHL